MATDTASPVENSEQHAARQLIVESVDVRIDPATLDRIFTVRTAESDPLVLRVPALAMPGILQELSRAVARSLN